VLNQEQYVNRLISSVNNAYDNIPFYRDLLKNKKPIMTLADIQNLPVVTKSDFVGKPAAYITRQNQKKIAITFATTGTTQEKLFVHLELGDFKNWLVPKARDALVNFIGIKKSDIILSTFGWELTQPGSEYAFGAIEAGAHIYPVGPGTITPSKVAVKIIAEKNISVVFATPSYALRLADAALENGIDTSILKIRCFVVTGETLTNAARKRIEQAWKTEVYNIYGMAETGLTGAECKAHSGMHLLTNYIFAEINRNQFTQSFESEQMGELVLTTIGKKGMPFIRYNTHDLVSLTDKPCSCGFQTSIIKAHFGRTDGMLKIKGRGIYPALIEEILLDTEEVSSNYRILIEHGKYTDNISVLAELKPGEAKTKKTHKKVADRIKEELGINLDVKLCKSGSLPHSEGWKEKRIIEVDVRKNTNS
jgi:phenylacetate-CoA ligase